MSQIATILQITIPYINAPAFLPIHTKVHKHPAWQNTPKPSPNIHATTPTPLLPIYTNNKPKKFIPHLCYYTDGSFQPSEQVIYNNVICWELATVGYGIYNPLQKIKVSERLKGLQNILRVEMTAIHHNLKLLNQLFPHEPTHIFTDSLNSLYLINTQIKHPTQQNNHLDKLLLADIVKMLQNRTFPLTIHKVRAYTNIIGNEEADKLAKEGNKIILIDELPSELHEFVHSLPYGLCCDDDHPYKGPIRNFNNYLKQLEDNDNKTIAQ
jgi:ribonuclease HI